MQDCGCLGFARFEKLAHTRQTAGDIHCLGTFLQYLCQDFARVHVFAVLNVDVRAFRQIIGLDIIAGFVGDDYARFFGIALAANIGDYLFDVAGFGVISL
jgi:hypothetical protein